jgi:hypothetical protein
VNQLWPEREEWIADSSRRAGYETDLFIRGDALVEPLSLNDPWCPELKDVEVDALWEPFSQSKEVEKELTRSM